MPDFIEENKVITEQALSDFFKIDGNDDLRVLTDAMEYSTMLGGKRIRPCLAIEFCKACGGTVEQALPFACAVEMVHTYSLIHDDLPCMDNDDMRRGKPSCHIKYGYANALLAGDSLLTASFGMIASNKYVNADAIREAVLCLSEGAGTFGMVGGQVMDLEYENKDVTAEKLMQINQLKTGCLLSSAAALGCIAAGADDVKKEAALKYAAFIGAAFQIVDDILDISGDESKLGKPIGSDAENGKHTYAAILGIDAAKKKARFFTDKAIEMLEPFENKDNLIILAEYLAARDH